MGGTSSSQGCGSRKPMTEEEMLDEMESMGLTNRSFNRHCLQENSHQGKDKFEMALEAAVEYNWRQRSGLSLDVKEFTRQLQWQRVRHEEMRKCRQRGQQSKKRQKKEEEHTVHGRSGGNQEFEYRQREQERQERTAREMPSQPTRAPPPKAKTEEELLRELERMGFTDRAMNQKALQKNKNTLQLAVEALIEYNIRRREGFSTEYVCDDRRREWLQRKEQELRKFMMRGQQWHENEEERRCQEEFERGGRGGKYYGEENYYGGGGDNYGGGDHYRGGGNYGGGYRREEWNDRGEQEHQERQARERQERERQERQARERQERERQDRERQQRERQDRQDRERQQEEQRRRQQQQERNNSNHSDGKDEAPPPKQDDMRGSEVDQALKDLGLPPGKVPSLAVLKAAYMKAAKRSHPDKNPGRQAAATEEFQRVKAAYEGLQAHLKS